jgi:sugar/nucleoside kinase (ribokinase family)
MAWIVLGAVNIDLEGTVDVATLTNRSLDSVQDWVEWRIVAGGTAGNIARHLSDLGEESVLVAIVGDDEFGDVALRLIGRDAWRCRITACRVRDARTGVVVLMAIDEPSRSRIVLGPHRSAVDSVTYATVSASLDGLASNCRDLIVDGYLMRSPREDWFSCFEHLAASGWRLHLELVPHSLGAQMRRDELHRLFGACQTVSSDIATIERLVNLEPDAECPPLARAQRLARRLTQGGARLPPTLVGRFGERGGQYALRMGQSVPPELIRYALGPTERKSVGDRLLAEELTGVSRHSANVTNLS